MRVRLIRAVPEVKKHLGTGELTLTSAAQIQRFVNAEQKVHPKTKAVSSTDKEKVVEACLGKSTREVEKTLFEKQSEPARILTQEKIRSLNAHRSEIKFTIDEATLEKLQQLKDLIGNLALEKIFDRALDALLLTEKKKRGVICAKTKITKIESAKSKSTDIQAGATLEKIIKEMATGATSGADNHAQSFDVKAYAKATFADTNTNIGNSFHTNINTIAAHGRRPTPEP